tara:strand:- start:540 stop:1364 length:825 start_codon:yes stop_codon:yes gene_type:complete
MDPTILALLAAISTAAGSALTKHLVLKFPPKQLIGPLFVCNSLFIFPLATFTPWEWSAKIIFLTLISIMTICLTALGVFELFTYGSASATTTAQATSPIAAAIGSALLLPTTFNWLEAVIAIFVISGVLIALNDSFPELNGFRMLVAGAATSIGGGIITVLSRQLLDEGAGLVQIYSIRTLIAGLLFIAFIPPTGLSTKILPVIAIRSFLIAVGFSLSILAVKRGSPTMVQTMLSTTPIFLLVWESLRYRHLPSPKNLFAVFLVGIGIVITIST